MMGYLDRLKGAVLEKQAPTVLQELQKAPFYSFCSTQGAHVSEIEDPTALWGRVAILEPGGRTVGVDSPSGYTLPDWRDYAERYHGPGCAVTAIAGLPKPAGPVNLDEALRAACDGMEGITVELFRSLLSPEDIKDIEAGAIHFKTLHAYAQSFAEGLRSGPCRPCRRYAIPAPYPLRTSAPSCHGIGELACQRRIIEHCLYGEE